MNLAVSLVGIVVGLLAAVGIFAPFKVLGWIAALPSRGRFVFAVVQRVVIGTVFIWAAPECRTPRIVFWLGIVTLLAALGILIAGRQRLDDLVAWWENLPTGLVMTSFAGAALFGCFLVYAGW